MALPIAKWPTETGRCFSSPVHQTGAEFYRLPQGFYLTGIDFYVTRITFYVAGMTFYLPGITFYHPGMTFYLAGMSFYLAGATFYLAEITFYLAEITFYHPEITFYLAGMSFYLAEASFYLVFTTVELPSTGGRLDKQVIGWQLPYSPAFIPQSLANSQLAIMTIMNRQINQSIKSTFTPFHHFTASPLFISLLPYD